MYASFITTRQFFSITQAAIVEDPKMGMDANKCANVVVLAGIGFGVAKVCTGLLVDLFEARIMTYGFMLATALVVFSFSLAESYEAMLVLGFLNSLPQAGGYPALNKIVYEYLPPERYSEAIAAISIGSRVGSSGSYLIFGACLRYFTWRQTIMVAPVLVLLTMALSSLVLYSQAEPIRKGAQAGATGTKGSGRSALQKLRWIAGSLQFWKVSFASACLLVTKGFEAIAPLFITAVLKLSPASSAMMVAAIPAGLVVSVMVGASYIDKLPLNQKSSAVISLCTLNFMTSALMCTLTWYIETNGSLHADVATFLCTGLFFVLGFSAGYSFYVPQSIFAIDFGGEDSATVVGCSELIQAVVGAASLKLAGVVSNEYGWRYVWCMITIFGMLGALSMASFQWNLEKLSAKKENEMAQKKSL